MVTLRCNILFRLLFIGATVAPSWVVDGQRLIKTTVEQLDKPGIVGSTLSRIISFAERGPLSDLRFDELIEGHDCTQPFRVRAATSGSTPGTDGALLASAASHAAVILPGGVDETSEANVTVLPAGLVPQINGVGAVEPPHLSLATVNLETTEGVPLARATPPKAYWPATSAVNE
jgi:hypothetical protein